MAPKLSYRDLRSSMRVGSDPSRFCSPGGSTLTAVLEDRGLMRLLSLRDVGRAAISTHDVRMGVSGERGENGW